MNRLVSFCVALSFLHAQLAWADSAPAIPPGAPFSASTTFTAPGAPVADSVGGLNVLGMSGGRELLCTRNAPPGESPLNRFVVSQQMGHSACYTPTGIRDIQVCFEGWGVMPGQHGEPASVWSASGLTVNNGGSGYLVGDILNEPYNTAAGDMVGVTVRVDAINTSGAIIAAHVENGGVYRAPIGAVAATSDISGVTIVSVNTYAAGTTFQVSFAQIIPVGTIVNGTNIPTNDTVTAFATGTGNVTVANATTGSGVSNNSALTFTSVGTGATFNFVWNGYALDVRVGFEPTYSAAGVAVTGNGPNVVRQLLTGPTGDMPQSPAVYANFDYANLMPSVDLLVPVNGIACTRPSAVNVPPGSTIGLRIWTNGLSSRRAGNLAPDEYFSAGTPPYADLTMSGSLPFNGTTGIPTSTLVRPTVYGTPYKYLPSVGVIGDSIAWGNTGTAIDYSDGSRNYGYVERALANTIPWASMANNGDTLAQMFQAGYGRNLRLDYIEAFNINNIYTELNENDARNGVAFSVTLPQEQQLAVEYRRRGVHTVGTNTSFPITNTSNVSATGCVNIEQRNSLLRVGLKTDGTGNYATPLASWTSASGNVTAGSGTVTMSGMTTSGVGGSTFSIVPGALINISDGSPEQVSVTSVSGNTWTATFVNSHNSPFNFTVQSPYYGYYDYVMDFGTAFEASIGSCTWANYGLDTNEGVHPAAGNQNAPGGAYGHGKAGLLLAPILAANIK